MTASRDRRRRSDRDLLARAAQVARRQAAQGQAESAVGRAPIVPYARYVFVGLLDELALSAGRGELPEGVRRLAVELAEKVVEEE
ncbi:hypothetical protein HUO13_22295 [Saccharopolyspora erythraea]|uniref:hypothetical protein n=1 Tax=Saccharopolyspora erythraea TaxID=1836 RepID=UPI001BA81B98|nr:hypothetical protein [Saccharopolyspora erythraea]QUH03191.1 hypothetical protein HUO13_22295 [Saccharopolyspora erythraea]